MQHKSWSTRSLTRSHVDDAGPGYLVVTTLTLLRDVEVSNPLSEAGVEGMTWKPARLKHYLVDALLRGLREWNCMPRNPRLIHKALPTAL